MSPAAASSPARLNFYNGILAGCNSCRPRLSARHLRKLSCLFCLRTTAINSVNPSFQVIPSRTRSGGGIQRNNLHPPGKLFRERKPKATRRSRPLPYRNVIQNETHSQHSEQRYPAWKHLYTRMNACSWMFAYKNSRGYFPKEGDPQVRMAVIQTNSSVHVSKHL